MELKRKKFQGVLNILSFNRHFYFFGGSFLFLIIVSPLFINWPAMLYWLVIVSFLYGLFMPLIVSAYVYDFSGFYHFDWLKQFSIDDAPNTMNININAGFDETSYIIKQLLPQSSLQVYDFYNPALHTEPAIIRARNKSLFYPNTESIDYRSIPLNNNTVDHIFLISAIHEIRKQDERVQFLKECKRICKPGGKIIMVEHLRDFPNFLAFTIGFTHFFSKATWIKAFEDAGLNSGSEKKFTPFMSIFYYQS